MQIKHVVALSGGKDSTAMALRLAEVEPKEYEYIITPTYDELPDVKAHWRRLEEMLGKPLTVLNHKPLVELIRDMGMLPNFRARWCTRILKIEPLIEYMGTLPAGSTQYVGLRADEEERRGLFGEDFKTRFPLREWGWGLKEVNEYLQSKGVCIPPRTDCALCYHQRLGEWWELWMNHPERYAQGVALEKEIGATFRTPGRDAWPSSLALMAERFARGERPESSLKRLERDREARCRVCSL